jgi:hypothetical protein
MYSLNQSGGCNPTSCFQVLSVFFLMMQGRFLCDNHVDCIDIVIQDNREIIFNCFAS